MGILDETGSKMTNEELRSLRASAIEAEREMEAQKMRIEADMHRMQLKAYLEGLKSPDTKDYEVETTWPPVSYGKSSSMPVEAYEPPIPGLRTEVRDDQFRCASCSKLHLAGERMAWVPDHLRRSDGHEAFVQAVAASNRSGSSSSSGWCMSCIPRPYMSRNLRVWQIRGSFEWIVLHTVLLPFLLTYRLMRMLLTPMRPAAVEPPKPKPAIARRATRENDDATWCRRALEADPDMTDAAGVPLMPLIDRDLPDLSAHRDAIIAADPSRTAEAHASYARGVSLIRAAIEEGVAHRSRGLDTAMDEKLRFLSARHPGAAETVQTRARVENDLREKRVEENGDESADDPRNFFDARSTFDDYDDDSWN
jgi:hypothetical protein